MPRPIHTEVDALVRLGDSVDSVDSELTQFKEVTNNAADRIVDAIHALTATLEKAIKDAANATCQTIEERT
jgi:hypothetical protein